MDGPSRPCQLDQACAGKPSRLEQREESRSRRRKSDRRDTGDRDPKTESHNAYAERAVSRSSMASVGDRELAVGVDDDRSLSFSILSPVRDVEARRSRWAIAPR